MAVLVNGPSSVLTLPPPPPHSSDHRRLHFGRSRILSGNNKVLFKSLRFRIRTFQHDGAESSDAAKFEVIPDDQNRMSDTAVESLGDKKAGSRSSFLSKLGILLGIAAVITLVLVGVNPPSLGTSTGIQFLQDGSSSTLVSSARAFSFRAFGCTVLLPEYAPGWIYFWLLMAAGCGLFISEEALNIWVGVTLARLLSLDGTWQSLVDSFSRNAPYILSTVLWVYWGVCISDMIPFYLGKFFRQSRASDDIRSKLGVGEEKAKEITQTVQRYGNLIGFVERFSLGVRNPTAFLAGAMNVSPECFFAGVCCGGLITLPLQLAIGFLLRERPVFALATVATVVGIWTVFPYALAALTALFFYLTRRYSS
ncbi:transmembrane protein [Perilla frutescens var. hirtella]|nr:transmembrane protein [Perilla frutescens var. hirtella]